MKAILVIDMDEEDIGREVNYINVKGGGMSYIVGAKDGQVLIRPLPSFKAVDLSDTRDVVMFCHGWNTCLGEIEK